MLKNAFNGDISDTLKNVGNLVKSSFGDSKNNKSIVMNTLLAIIVFIMILILGIMANL
jgi:hypothetical protein